MTTYYFMAKNKTFHKIDKKKKILQQKNYKNIITNLHVKNQKKN